MNAAFSTSDPDIVHPAREKPRFRPLEAMRRMRRLIADKEDTEQVFHIISALNGDHLLREMKAFANRPAGAERIQARRYLPPILDNHDELQKLPEGSVGRAYVDFMQREGLSAQGLVDESEKFHGTQHDDLVGWFGNRKRDTHDLFHVLSGYGRDGLGEAALLAFTYGQSRGGRGVIFISYMACRQVRKYAPPGVDVMACFHEGRRNGEAAASILEQNMLKLLEEPLEAARERLNIKPPLAYQRGLERMQAVEINEGALTTA